MGIPHPLPAARSFVADGDEALPNAPHQIHCNQRSPIREARMRIECRSPVSFQPKRLGAAV